MFVKGDKIRVIASKDKGVEAVVLTALPKVNKVVVEGVNIIKNTNVQMLKNPQRCDRLKRSSNPCSNVQVLDKNGVAGRDWLQICRRQKSSLQQKIRQCLTNLKGKGEV